ncbi:hypothetical protein EV182_001173 [Spiromyces aspiralis]|uniref:Uncharacterized protein n=1 Tax=Spiromyces aspiralis TaxID=68401 RepID=A0ACC1HH11_9FUNG|nr:hypothetical protein EV182_001173 [Spiromyces aspiralis]
MFHTRFSLFKQIYTHRAAAEIELMIIDAMVAADPVLKLSEAIYSPKDYLYLTDNILTEIERSKDSQLAEAQRIIRRIRYRDLYKFVDEFIIPHEFLPHINEAIISWNRIHYGTGQKNPIENIRFFSQFDLNKSFHIPSDKISLCVPAKFEENSMLVFARDTTKRKAIQKAARKFMSKANVNYASSSLSVLSTAAQLAPQQGDTLPGQFDVSPKKRKFSISSSQ